MSKRHKVVGHRVLIKMLNIDEKKSQGGIILTTADHDEDSDEAIVVGIGSEAYKDVGDGTPWCKIGDKIVTQRYPGKRVPIADQHLRIINDEDVLAIIEEN